MSTSQEAYNGCIQLFALSWSSQGWTSANHQEHLKQPKAGKQGWKAAGNEKKDMSTRPRKSKLLVESLSHMIEEKGACAAHSRPRESNNNKLIVSNQMYTVEEREDEDEEDYDVVEHCFDVNADNAAWPSLRASAADGGRRVVSVVDIQEGSDTEDWDIVSNSSMASWDLTPDLERVRVPSYSRALAAASTCPGRLASVEKPSLSIPPLCQTQRARRNRQRGEDSEEDEEECEWEAMKYGVGAKRGQDYGAKESRQRVNSRQRRLERQIEAGQRSIATRRFILPRRYRDVS